MAEVLLSRSETFDEVAHNSWIDPWVPGWSRVQPGRPMYLGHSVVACLRRCFSGGDSHALVEQDLFAEPGRRHSSTSTGELKPSG